MTNAQRADAAYKAVIAYMDNNNYKYTSNDKDRKINISFRSDDFDIELTIVANENTQRMSVWSPMPYKVKPDRIIDTARAINYINCRSRGGDFELDLANSNILYSDTEFFAGLSGFSAEYGDCILNMAHAMVNKYNDQLYAVSQGLMSFHDFVRKNQ